MKKFFFFFFCSFFLFSPARAEDRFRASYEITYKVNQTGLTTTTQNVKITNLTTEYYVTEYAIDINSANLENISARDTSGLLEPEITKTSDQTKIKVKFKEKIVGQDKTLRWTLSYTTGEIAHQSGRIWEINIPPLPKTEGLSNFTVYLQTPKTFGDPLFVKPSLANQVTTCLATQAISCFSWSGEQVGTSGIAVSFGDYQIFDFNLKYHLKNSRPYPVETEIALPPDTDYQRVALISLNPRPKEIRVDEDGNWLGRYQLNAGQKMDITATGSAFLFFQPRTNVDKQRADSTPDVCVGTHRECSRRDIVDGVFLKPQKFWESTNPQIKKLAEELKTPEAIYDYVVKTLRYDYQRVTDIKERFGAAKALAAPAQSVCMEFTDLFIAIARAAGIPARELNGYAYTTSQKFRPLSRKDLLHSWPEYWNETKQQWIMVDPTWEKTTGGVDYFHQLDLNHFVLAIKGKDSQYPVPAGSYKIGDEDTKDVEITFGDGNILNADHFNCEQRAGSTPDVCETLIGGVAGETLFSEVSRGDIVQYLDIKISFPQTIIAGLKQSGKITISNHGPFAFYPQSDLKLFASRLSLQPSALSIEPVLPFNKYEIDFSVNPTSWQENFTDAIVADLDGQTAHLAIVTKPFYLIWLDKITQIFRF